MITKGEIVDFAVRKLVGDRSTSLTGINPDSYANGVNDLEGMMARWQVMGIELYYNFAGDRDVNAWSQHDSGLELWMMQPVAYNLALVIAEDFKRDPPASVISNASKGWRAILRKCQRRPVGSPALPLPQGRGEMTETGSPMTGFGHARKN
ncbi:packaged DNA stabilization gp4 family protein [Klebsiella aerogenes]|uniref:packaged DNA stabilization gp4 family protein n=1 Tax=Klebsiella aerogenes TaxID=548 RepID=UPI00351D3F44